MWLFLVELAVAAEPEKLATTGAGQMLTVIGALLLVIAAIYASVWGIKRLSHFTQQGEGQLKLISGLMVGPKERVILIDCAGQKLLLGVASGQVNLLHTLSGQAPSSKSEFDAILKQAEKDD
ncbi:MAG TPA: flagellar biosynthetic protein FliO [Pseudomonadales bacterium]|nr:flagellar biosynthetic protein FliO [Pseudomonadales bacterium]